MKVLGLSRSTFYYKRKNEDLRKNNPGRPVIGYSFKNDGTTKIVDEVIKENIKEILGTTEGSCYGYKKMTYALRDEESYSLTINFKKVYRLCKELKILHPERRKVYKYPKKIARPVKINQPNELWQMDIKYGYLKEEKRFFYVMSIIDVCDRNIIEKHIGLTCRKEDAVRTLKNALRNRGLLNSNKKPIIRTDNGTQFTNGLFQYACEELGMKHELIPVRTPNMNAYIESFHSILERECFKRHEFDTFLDAYVVVNDFIDCYNEKRIHSSCKYMSPRKYFLAIQSKTIKPQLTAA